MSFLESFRKAHRFVLMVPDESIREKKPIMTGAKRPSSDLTSVYLTESLMSKKWGDFQESD